VWAQNEDDTGSNVMADPCAEDAAPDQPSHPDLYCIALLPAPGITANGVALMEPAASPFGVAVTSDGIHRYSIRVRIDGLPDPASLGPYTTYVAWTADPLFAHVENLGAVKNGEQLLGEVALNKFLLIITAEPSADVEERGGRLVLRGQSPSNLLQPHDLFSLTPLAALRGSEEDSSSGSAHRTSHQHGDPVVPEAASTGWSMPPMHPQIPMAPGMDGIAPRVTPYLPRVVDPEAVPMARPRELLSLADGDTLRLISGLVRRHIGNRTLLMFGFNGQYPGPLIEVKEDSEIIVRFENRLPMPTSVHWHGVRLENRFDGVPGLTQEPVMPGDTFLYRVHFPDAGIFWYHPHVREDIQQDLGLYGNMLVRPSDPDALSPVNREEVLMLDDLLLDETGILPYGQESANFMLMGRFGNLFLVNGEPNPALSARKGEVVRYYVTNVSNTRTFNVEFTGARLKVVGSDIGRFEREEWVESIVMAPAERYIVEARFEEPGTHPIVNRVHAFNHRAGTFLAEVDTLAVVEVEDRSADVDYAETFTRLRHYEDVSREIESYRQYFDQPVDRELIMTLEMRDVPVVIDRMMRYDRLYFNPVEWSDTMPMMNWVSTGREVRWILRDPGTGKENMDIEWTFRRGEVIKVRITNDRNAFHAMQHPIHVHGQRFLVLSQNGVPNGNFVWKDTVLLPVGSETDILIDLANPGKWMVHCHIAEHLDSGMMMVINVME